MIATAFEHGIDISNLTARQFQADDFDLFDVIFAMDSSNYRDIISLAKNDIDKQKVKNDVRERLFLIHTMVAMKGFEHVYQLFHESCPKFLENIVKGKSY